MGNFLLTRLQSKTKVEKLGSFSLRPDTQSMGYAAFLNEDYYDEDGNRQELLGFDLTYE